MFKENFERICAKKGLYPSNVVVAVGLNQSTYSLWTEKSVPRKTTLYKIADYLGVTVEELLAEDQDQSKAPEKTKSAPTQMDRDAETRAYIISLFDRMTDDEQKDTMRHMEEIVLHRPKSVK